MSELPTTDDAAAMVGVHPSTVRQWVRRGYLAPVSRGASPLRFRAEDVLECFADRQSNGWHARVDTLRGLWLRLSAESVTIGPAELSPPSDRGPERMDAAGPSSCTEVSR